VSRKTIVEMKPQTLSEMQKAERRSFEAEFGQYGQIVHPGDAEAPILTPPVRAALHQWLYEMNSAPALEEVGLKPRTRALLSGPPGCGKTTLAHHMTARMGLPMLIVQSAEVITKWIGGTGENINKLFREARRASGEIAIFFDEFDAMAHKRQSTGTSAGTEKNNIVIALLQEMDRFEGMLFAATNMSVEIDPAIWRRFQLQIEIGFPGEEERFAIMRRYLAPFAVHDDTIAGLAAAFDGASPALIKECGESIRRSLVLGPKMGLSNALEDIMARFVVSAAPSEGVPTPRLWESPSIEIGRLAKLPWPPVMS